jgi:hypothetical protein
MILKKNTVILSAAEPFAREWFCQSKDLLSIVASGALQGILTMIAGWFLRTVLCERGLRQ